MEARISKHMNDDHSDSLLAWAHFYAKLPTATHATATTLTDQGFGLDVTLANGTVTPATIPFDPPLKSASDVRKVAVAMHFAAYNALGFRYKLTMGFYSGVARMAWTHMPARICDGKRCHRRGMRVQVASRASTASARGLRASGSIRRIASRIHLQDGIHWPRLLSRQLRPACGDCRLQEQVRI